MHHIRPDIRCATPLHMVADTATLSYKLSNVLLTWESDLPGKWDRD